MNVSLKNIDAVNGVVKVEIVKADYAEKVDKELRAFRQKANVSGFRKGMAPIGLVKQMYGKPILVDEINKLVSEALFAYIREKQLNVLGEPMPSLTEQPELNFETQEDFELAFDVALAPEIELELNKNDKFPYCRIAVDEEMVNNQLESYKANFGIYDQVEEATEKDMIKGLLLELEEDGVPKDIGIVVEKAVLVPSHFKNEEEKAKFIGAKVHDVVVFNPHNAYDGSEPEIISLLDIDKELGSLIVTDFSFEITEITRYKEAEMNADLFEKVLGKDVVSTEEEFRAKVKEILAEQLVPESDFKFIADSRELLLAKVGELTFPDAILKRWLLTSDKKRTAERVDAEYPFMIEDLTYHIVKEHLVKVNDIQVLEADLIEFAKRIAKAQFAQYGMLSVPEDMLDNYAREMLKKEDTGRGILERTMDEKLASWLKNTVTLEYKEVTHKEFEELLDK